ncbi:MAG: OmpH family outer membrane protein [Planctomycetota bacterium]
MNIPRCIAYSLIAAVAVISTGQTVQAQTNVALCDIGMVFKNHPVFSAQLEQLKQEADQFQAQTAQLQQELMRKANALQQYRPDSDEYRNAESELAQESARLEVEQRDAMRQLMQREAELHYETYLEVTNLIGRYCQTEGIQMVLRYNSEEMDPTNPASIMQRVNGNVIFHRDHKDITADIIREIGQSNAAAGIPAERR